MSTERYGRYKKHYDHNGGGFHLDRDTKIGLGIMLSILLAVFFLTNKSIGDNVPKPGELTSEQIAEIEKARKERVRDKESITGAKKESHSIQITQETPRTTPAPLRFIEPEAAPAPAYIVYTIKSGDTLSRISAKYLGSDSQWRKIAKYNNLNDSQARNLRVGAKIKIPTKKNRRSQTQTTHPTRENRVPRYSTLILPGQGTDDTGHAERSTSSTKIYTVKSGDSLYRLAEKLLGSTRKMEELKRKNPSVNWKSLPLGHKIKY